MSYIWQLRGLDIDGETSGDRSGFSVSLSANGTVVAIGAIFNDGINSIVNDNRGQVRVYAWDNTSWQQRGSDIDGETSGDQSGYSVSLSANGDVVAIGALYNDGNGNSSGHVRVYAWDNTSWQQRGSDIDGETSGDNSGYSVSLSANGTVVAIGAIFNDGINSNIYDSRGHVRVYAWDNTSWQQRGSDIDGETSGDQSGYSVSLSANGDVVAIGAPYNDGNGNSSGHVRVYNYISAPAPAPAPSPEPAPAPAPAPTPSISTVQPQPVSINFNVLVDASSNISVFGAAPDVSLNNIIVAKALLPVNALYESTGNSKVGLIEFWEPSDNQNIIKAALANSDTSASGGPNLGGAFHIATERLAKGIQRLLCDQFDCSLANPYNSSKYKKGGVAIPEYTVQRDFARVALGTLAHHMFGHVDATAAISNDIAFIKNMLSLGVSADSAASNESIVLSDASSTNGVTVGGQDRYGQFKYDVSGGLIDASWGISSANDANLARRLVREIVLKGYSGDSIVDQTADLVAPQNTERSSLAYLVQQVIGQDASRAMDEDNSERTKNMRQLLRFYPGDKIYLQITVNKPSIVYSDGLGSGQKVAKETLSALYANIITYTLEITLGATESL